MAFSPPASALLPRIREIRSQSEALIIGLEPEDLCLQGMADASPPKWHLGHTTWFFEEFLLRAPALAPLVPGYGAADSRWAFLFNSYYDSVGARHPRPQRGLLTRPAIAAVLAWRQRVNQALEVLLEGLNAWPAAAAQPWLDLLELGLQHEQQHQELLLMDLLDGFSRNPLEPAGGSAGAAAEAAFQALATTPNGTTAATAPTPGWRRLEGGLVNLGHGGGSFHFDNEAPRHRVWLEPFELAEQLVSNGAYGAFIADGGYRRPELWMSEGWALVQERGWQAPRYWRGDWEYTLAGRRPRNDQAPVRHLSWFEADAFARWSGARLPTEAEWEVAAASLPQTEGLVWQWTASPYRPYPGFVAAPGAVGEYNGKFMTSQFVLRGGGYLTPQGHSRHTYRNFFPPACRWMASGVRLARGGEPQ